MDSSEVKLIPSQKGKSKLYLDGYLYKFNRSRHNLFYWRCDETGCIATAGTRLVGQTHEVRYNGEHTHAPNQVISQIAQIRDELKISAINSNDAPARLIQTVLANHPEAAVYAGNRDAMRQVVKRARRADLPAEPSCVNEIFIPENLKIVNGEQFLIADVTMANSGKLLVFGTVENMSRLQSAPYWIMDGTFKTAPSIFRQMYSIHAPFGVQQDSTRIVPLVYALMTEKSEEFYSRLFEEIMDFANEHDIELAPQFIIQDFEQAAISAAKRCFPSSTSIGCHFHLGQSLWRKIQECGLASRYGNDLKFALQIRHLTALALYF